MRLRDSALSLDDYSLWKTHELDDVDPTATCPWPGSGQLLEEALFLVPENMPAGKVNGKRLAARSPLHSEPGSASSSGILIFDQRGRVHHHHPQRFISLSPLKVSQDARGLSDGLRELLHQV